MTMDFESIRLGSIPSKTSITAFYSENTMVLTIQEKTRQDKIKSESKLPGVFANTGK